jgi:hypothetical protein
LAEILGAVFCWLLTLEGIHFEVSELIEIDDSLNDWNGSSGDSVEVLDHLPLLKVLGENVEAVNHLLAIWQEKIRHRHIHITRLQCQACYQRSKLLDLGLKVLAG